MRTLNLRLKIIAVTVISPVIIIFINRIFLYLAGTASIDFQDGSHFWELAGNFFLTTALPAIIIFTIIIYFLLLPLQKMTDEMVRGQNMTQDLRNKVLKLLSRLPSIFLIMYTFSFLAGSISFSLKNHSAELISVDYVVVYVISTIFMSIMAFFIQLNFNNLILSKPRAYLKIHFIEDESHRVKFFTLKNKNLLYTLSVTGYVLSFFFVQMYHVKSHDTRYEMALESVVLKKKSMTQAKEEYTKYMREYIRRGLGINTTGNIKVDFPIKRSRDERYMKFLLVFIYSFILYIVLAVLIKYFYTLEFVGQLRRIQEKMHSISRGEGDLSRRLNIVQFEELGELSDTINRFMQSLADMLRKVMDMTGKVQTSSESLTRSAQNASAAAEETLMSLNHVSDSTSAQIHTVDETRSILSHMLESLDKVVNHINTQSAFVEETAGSISEMVSNIKSVRDVTSQADKLARSLVTVAHEGGLSVKNSVSAIREIEESSQHVTEIVAVISQIAEQTNLLAMNAAIEAAHAGNAGKGFAVVADEVRKLAENSSQSAHEIISHIQTMNDRINNGAKLVTIAGQAFDRISSDINETSKIMGEISSAMEEQTRGSNDILTSIESVVSATNDVKSLTQQEKANSESVYTSMEKLVNVSSQINTSVEEQTKANQEIVHLVEEVQQVADVTQSVVKDLHSMLTRFNLDDRNQGSGSTRAVSERN